MTARPALSLEYALLGALALLWGSSYLFTKTAVAEIPPTTLVALRVSGAAAFLLAAMGIRGERLPAGRALWGAFLAQSVLGSIAAWLLLAWGQARVDASLASVLNSTSPIFVLLITALFLRHEPLRPVKMLGAGLGLCGVVMIVGLEALNGLGDEIAGQLACLAGAACYGAAAIYGRRFKGVSPLSVATGAMLWATAVLVPAAFLLEDPLALSPSVKALGAAAMLAIPCTGVALLIYFRLIQTLGSLGAASQAFLRAGVGVMLGVLLLGESVRASVGVGLLITILGVALINWPPAREKARPMGPGLGS